MLKLHYVHTMTRLTYVLLLRCSKVTFNWSASAQMLSCGKFVIGSIWHRCYRGTSFREIWVLIWVTEVYPILQKLLSYQHKTRWSRNASFPGAVGPGFWSLAKSYWPNVANLILDYLHVCTLYLPSFRGIRIVITKVLNGKPIMHCCI